MRIAFLGPEGSFTSAAATAVAGSADRLPLRNIPDVVEAVRTGKVDRGVVPIENSIEGAVNLTLDTLAFGEPGVYLRREVTVPIRMNVLVQPGRTLEDITELRSHAVAIPQSREWIDTHLPGVAIVTTTSTARAAEEVAAGDGTLAALGPVAAAEEFGLDVAAADVQDREGNTTRFVELARSMAQPTGSDKTSIVVFFGEDRPGLLMRVLDEFALRNINLTKIESRPTKTQLGEYCIFIDAVGHLTDARMAEALRSVHRHVHEVRILGTYPRLGADPEPPPLTDSDQAYAEAAAWFQGVADLIRPDET